MSEYSLSTTHGRLVNAQLAARILGLAHVSIRTYCRRYGIGTKLADQWWLTDDEIGIISKRQGKRRHA